MYASGKLSGSSCQTPLSFALTAAACSTIDASSTLKATAPLASTHLVLLVLERLPALWLLLLLLLPLLLLPLLSPAAGALLLLQACHLQRTLSLLLLHRTARGVVLLHHQAAVLQTGRANQTLWGR